MEIKRENTTTPGGAILTAGKNTYEDGSPADVGITITAYEDEAELSGPEDHLDRLEISLDPDDADAFADALHDLAKELRG